MFFKRMYVGETLISQKDCMSEELSHRPFCIAMILVESGGASRPQLLVNLKLIGTRKSVNCIS